MAKTAAKRPTPDFPLSARSNGQWAKKVKGKFFYFGPINNPDGALRRYNAWLAGEPNKPTVATNGKPRKPHPDFPLYAHACGQWAKRVRGKDHYFGPWGDPNKALDNWNNQKDDLLAGRDPSRKKEGLTVTDLVKEFIARKKALVETGELHPRTLGCYEEVAKVIEAKFGDRLLSDLRPADFAALRQDFAAGYGPVSICGYVGRSRVIFNFAFKEGLIDRPPMYGDAFKKPSLKVLRVERLKRGPRMFQQDELALMLASAKEPLRTMILLGINCGFGNTDCGTLPMSVLDLEAGWVDYGRQKTGIQRRCPLWPETVKALRETIAKRRKPIDPKNADVLFLTKYGNTWEPRSYISEKTKNRVQDDPIGKETAKLLKEIGIYRPKLNFYALRHTFQTIGEKSRDKDAVRYIMGHVPSINDMSDVYNEEAPEDDRLLAVTEFVRKWLFPQSANTAS